MLDSWIQIFNEKIVPTSAKFGVTVVGAWVNRPQNEFIWVRTYATDETLKTYEESAERATYTDKPGRISPRRKCARSRTDFARNR